MSSSRGSGRLPNGGMVRGLYRDHPPAGRGPGTERVGGVFLCVRTALEAERRLTGLMSAWPWFGSQRSGNECNCAWISVAF